jgi:hypothetical protein
VALLNWIEGSVALNCKNTSSKLRRLRRRDILTIASHYRKTSAYLNNFERAKASNQHTKILAISHFTAFMIGAQHHANGAKANSPSPGAPFFPSTLKNPDLSLVSPLCGPGSTALWFLVTVCLILTWTVPRMKIDQDRVSPLLIFASIIPIIAGLHEAYLVYNYPGDRFNLTSWRISHLEPTNYSILNNHIIVRTSMLVQSLVIIPISTYRMRRKQGQVAFSFLGPLMLGYFSMDIFRFRMGEEMTPICRDARGNVIYIRRYRLVLFSVGLQLTFTMALHYTFLSLRAVWRRYRHSDLGFLDEAQSPEKEGWRGWIPRFRNRTLKPGSWADWLNLFTGVFVYPCLVLWFIMPTVVEDYLEYLQLFDRDQMWEQHLVALRLTFLPRSNYSIWDWRQMILLALGVATLIYTGSGTSTERKIVRQGAAKADLKNLESGIKRDS